jgi:hypothetical protein
MLPIAGVYRPSLSVPALRSMMLDLGAAVIALYPQPAFVVQAF